MSVSNALDTFGKRVQQQARANLTRDKRNASGKLYDDTSYNLNVSANSFSLRFNLSDNKYWEFVDAGVKGVGGKKANGEPYVQKNVIGSPFSYKSKKPPAKIFETWAKQKGISPRGKNGRFTTFQSFGFAVANSVFHTGLETTKFFSKPFENEFKKLPDEVVQAFALELEDLLKFTTS